MKCIIPKSRTFKHFLTFLPDAYLATKISDMSGKNLTYGNPSSTHSAFIFMFGRWNKRMELLRRSLEELSSAAELETNSLRRAITLVSKWSQPYFLFVRHHLPTLQLISFLDGQTIHFFALHLEQLLESLHWTDC